MLTRRTKPFAMSRASPPRRSPREAHAHAARRAGRAPSQNVNRLFFSSHPFSLLYFFLFTPWRYLSFIMAAPLASLTYSVIYRSFPFSL